MATRFRLPSAGTAEVSPAVQSYSHTGTTRRPLPLTDSSALTTTAITPDAADHIAAGDTFHAQFVSAALGAQVLASGMTVSLAIQGLEPDLNNNLFLQLWLGVYDNTGTVLLATLRAKVLDNLELTTAITNRNLTTTTTAAYTCGGGERLVAEISLSGTPGASGGIQGHNGSLRFGSNGAGGDLGANDTDTGATLNPWLEVSQTLTWLALTDSIACYWKLDEASGTRNDTVGSEHLTDVNTVASTTGRINTAASFVQANSEALSHVDDATIGTGDINFTLNLWVYFAGALPADGGILLSKTDGLGANGDYQFMRTGTNLQWIVRSGAGHSTIASVTTPLPSIDTWHMLTVDHDAVNNQVGIAVDAGTRSAVGTGGTAAGRSNTPFRISGDGNNNWNITFLADEVGFWKRSLTAAERTTLYQSGAGLGYPFILPTTVSAGVMAATAATAPGATLAGAATLPAAAMTATPAVTPAATMTGASSPDITARRLSAMNLGSPWRHQGVVPGMPTAGARPAAMFLYSGLAVVAVPASVTAGVLAATASAASATVSGGAGLPAGSLTASAAAPLPSMAGATRLPLGALTATPATFPPATIAAGVATSVSGGTLTATTATFGGATVVTGGQLTALALTATPATFQAAVLAGGSAASVIGGVLAATGATHPSATVRGAASVPAALLTATPATLLAMAATGATYPQAARARFSAIHIACPWRGLMVLPE